MRPEEREREAEEREHIRELNRRIAECEHGLWLGKTEGEKFVFRCILCGVDRNVVTQGKES